MKTKSIITLLLIYSGLVCFGQKHPSLDLTTGGGLVEAIHLGCKIQILDKNQIGLYYGNSLLYYRYSYNSLSFDHQWHFGNTSNLSNRPSWFCRQGLTYSIDNAAYSETKYVFVSICIGREFNISHKIGVSLDLGLFHTLMEKERVKDTSISPWFDTDMKDIFVFPNIRLQLYYSL